MGTNQALNDNHDFYTDDASNTVWEQQGIEDNWADVRTAPTYGIGQEGVGPSTRLIPLTFANVEGNVAVGRDAQIHALVITDSVAVGNKANAGGLEVIDSVHVGRGSGEDTLYAKNVVVIGTGAASKTNVGEDSVIAGNSALKESPSYRKMVVIGHNAGESIGQAATISGDPAFDTGS